jgi:hypothetical protein
MTLSPRPLYGRRRLKMSCSEPRALGKACMLQGKQSLYPLYGREQPCSQTQNPNDATVMMNKSNNLLLIQSIQQVVFKWCKIRVNQHRQNWGTKHTQPKQGIRVPQQLSIQGTWEQKSRKWSFPAKHSIHNLSIDGAVSFILKYDHFSFLEASLLPSKLMYRYTLNVLNVQKSYIPVSIYTAIKIHYCS